MKTGDIRYIQNGQNSPVTRQKKEVKRESEGVDTFTPSGHTEFKEEKVIMPPNLNKVNINKTLVKFAESLEEKSKEDGQKEWTVLFYMDGANDLEPFIAKSILDLEKVGSNNKVNLVAEIARAPQDKVTEFLKAKEENIDNNLPQVPSPKTRPEDYLTNIDKDWSGIRRYYITKHDDYTPSNIYSSNMIKDMGNKDVSDPQTLADFVSWGIKNYPAKKYMLVIMDHGSGWPGAITNDVKDKQGTMMSTPSITEALDVAEAATGKKLDVIHFATCLMGSSEVAYQLKDSANYMVSSQEMGTTDALNYSGIIEKLNKEIENNFSDPKSVSQMIVSHFNNNKNAFITHSAVDLSKMTELKNSLNEFAISLGETEVPMELIKNILKKTQHYGSMAPYRPFKDYRDLKDIATVITEDPRIKDEGLKEKATKLKEAIEKAVIGVTSPSIYTKEEKLRELKEDNTTTTYWRTTEVQVKGNGLSIYLPLEENDKYRNLKDDYSQLDIAKETQWDEFVKKEIDAEHKQVQLSLDFSKHENSTS